MLCAEAAWERERPWPIPTTLNENQICAVNRQKPVVYNDFSSRTNAIKIPIQIGRVYIDALIDTGAEVSAVADNFLALLSAKYACCVEGDRREVYSASNNVMISHGIYKIEFLILGGFSKTVEHDFVVLHNLRGGMILGLDFIFKHGIIIDGQAKSLTFLSGRIHKPIVAKIDIGPIIDERLEIKFQLSHLTKDVENEFLKMFEKHRTTFARSMLELGCARRYTYSIKVEGPPVSSVPYSTTINQRPILQHFIEEMLEHDIIRPSVSPYSAPVVLVKKKSGELRFCVDYRKLNAVTVKYQYPIPNINGIFDNFFGAKIFSTLDLFSGYWQIKMKEGDIEKTAFTCEAGHFEFKRLPFRLSNAPAAFQRLMNVVLAKAIKKKIALVYLDDVVVYSDSFVKHVEHLDEVLTLLEEAGLKLKPIKCEFAKKEVIYLGHIITPEGVKPNPAKIQDVLNYPAPKNVNQIRTFLGLAGYYRRFVKDFAQIAHPLTNLTRKNVDWTWGDSESNAFEVLKRKLTSSPILQYPDVSKGYVLHTDASEYGIGAVLSQVQDIGEGIPLREVVIAYTSKQLLERERKWATVEKETYAIVHAVKVFRTYIYGQQITVYSDHKPLEWLMSKNALCGRLSRWSLILQEYNLEIKYRPGKSNQNADTLSRIPIEEITSSALTISAVSISRFPSTEEMIDAQKNDAYCQSVLIGCKGEFEIDEGLLKMKGRIVVPLSIRLQVIERFHDHKLAGHLGISKVFGRAAARYIWPKMRVDISNFIKSCETCVKRKPYGGKVAPLQPISPITFIWQRIAMDIVGPLPETYNGNRYILVMSEYTTRYMIGVAIKDQKASTFANAFIINVVLRYGSPTEILTDQGTNFCSKLMK